MVALRSPSLYEGAGALGRDGRPRRLHILLAQHDRGRKPRHRPQSSEILLRNDPRQRFLGVYCGLLGYIGQRTGLTLDLLAHRSFGSKGSYLPSALISFTQIGWFGVGVAMFAIPVAGLINNAVPMWALIVITGVVMTVTAYLGIKALAVLGSIAVPLIAVLGVYSVNWGINEVGGFMNVFAQNPDKPLTLAAGIAIVVGSFISGGTATPNFTRFARTPSIAVVATVVAFFVGNSIMMIFGAVGGAVTGVPDIFDVLILQGLAIPAVLTLGLNIWTTNNNALYTAGLGVSNITKIPNKPLVLVSGAIARASRSGSTTTSSAC